MAAKKIIPCLDIKDGKVVKGVKFQDVKDIASPADLAKYYSNNGADELVFYDITASSDGRKIFADVLNQVVSNISIPLTVGGGVSTLDDFETVIANGASKVSITTGALKNPQLIADAAKKYGSDKVVLAVDVMRVDGIFRVFLKGGREDSGLEMTQWIKQGEALGAGELVVNSIDTDGVKQGFDLPMLEAARNAVKIPIIASGGAGCIEDFIELFTKLPDIESALAASVFHFGTVKIPELKQALLNAGISVTLA
ncbi:MAG: imidazole glycerol phosphate synthase subunit HisF [Oscillospiraceae bacterium]|nr:imidazole glycerol phosphate synthase subunit HisF [Oscillospiraceae bacterium]